MVRRAQRRGPVLGRRDRAGGHQELRRLVRRRGPAPRARRHRRGRPGLRRGPAGPGRRDQPPADRRPGAARHRGRRGQPRRTSSTPRTPATSTPACSATAARSPSPPPRSTPAPPRSAAPGTPASRRSSSTRCSAPRPTRRCCRAPSALGWGDRGCGRRRAGHACRRSGARPTCSTTYAAPRGPRAWTRSAPARATGSWCCSAGSATASTSTSKAARAVLDFFGPGPVVVGPAVDDLEPRPRQRPRRAVRAPGRHRLAGRAAAGAVPTSCCPSAPWPATATPAVTWSRRCTCPLVSGRDTLVETLATYFASGRSLEATARVLFCHPNTVRYRLRQIGDLTGLTPTDAARRLHPRDRPGPGPAVGPRVSALPAAEPALRRAGAAADAPRRGRARLLLRAARARPSRSRTSPWPSRPTWSTRPTGCSTTCPTAGSATRSSASRTAAGLLAGRADRLRRRGRGLLRRPPAAHRRRPCSPRPTTSSRPCCPDRDPLRERYRAWERCHARAGRHDRAADGRRHRGGARPHPGARGAPRRRDASRWSSCGTTSWLGYHEYVGDLHGRISINVDLPRSAPSLLHPRAARGVRRAPGGALPQGGGPRPRARACSRRPSPGRTDAAGRCVSEGLAELVHRAAARRRRRAGLRGHRPRRTGSTLDLGRDRAVAARRRAAGLARVRRRPLMLHAEGAPRSEVRRVPPPAGPSSTSTLRRARVRFLDAIPTSRSYVICYPAGLGAVPRVRRAATSSALPDACSPSSSASVTSSQPSL